jgi:hypothetical protein
VVSPHQPSYRNYLRGCSCPGCRKINRERVMSYRERRLANNGMPLGRPEAKMPSTITRLRREIGIVAPWRP